ncbi:hypothetical protein [Lentzea sp. HUAS12]|uniref:hypothetical protein n=1 Tax=Lentzea sp. HUAS12 TaxID=2951806 RepID=UPI0020A22651|nr:hypothetical protein [Lentzea sp. HUAS12]USX56235.1 hypothetical protein ND450_19675 [Lentzea sp. HUAS12]
MTSSTSLTTDYNSILNKTPLTARTNRIIGGRAPSTYLRGLAKSAETTLEQVDLNVQSHQISPEALRADDFQAAMTARESELLALISSAMGKDVQNDTETN